MANEGLWEQLEKLDCTQTAVWANCSYLKESKQYILKMLNKDCTVDISHRTIYLKNSGPSFRKAKYLEELCVLSYLINAKELPLSNKLVSAEALPGGQFFFRGHHKLPVEKLAMKFGNRPEDLYEVSGQFNAKKTDYGDASVSLFVFPRIPLTIIIWEKCTEFEARASILFDQTVSYHLPLDALLVAVNLTVESLTHQEVSES